MDGDGGPGRAADDAPEAAETRVVLDSEGRGDEVASPDSFVSDSEAETVLTADDDRTQLVTRPAEPRADSATVADAEKATRVIDVDARPSRSRASGDSEAATRLMDERDKTAPPAVEAGGSGSSGRPRDSAPPPPTPIDNAQGLAPGMVLFGEYEIVNVLGIGGMGEVYRARHRRLDEHRAIKVMHADLSKKKGASEFFYREAKALLAVRHPAVVHCHDLLSDDEGRVYLIMEMIEGIPLSKKMNEGPLSPDEVAILGARVSHGLSAAHRKGVIHRDVSPDNIVLPNGRVQEAKLIDFGIAKILQEGEGTIVDGFKGKLSYASPEQLGFFGGKMDGRSDFYSLGLVLVAAALGRPMQMGTTVMEAVDARRGFASLPDEIPIGLRSAIQPLLALDPKDRPKYVDRLFVVPGGMEGGTDSGVFSRGGFSPRVGTAQEEAASEPKGNRFALFGGLAAGAAALVGGGIFFATGGQVPPATEAEVSPPARVEREASIPAAKPVPVVAEQPPAPVREEADAVAALPVAKPAAKPAPRRLSASDRIKIIGLLSNAKLALSENRLMSPANDNAYDRYRRVLSLDPNNEKARAGLRQVAGRYLGLAEDALSKGDPAQARAYLERAKKADPEHPRIGALESRLLS